MIYNRAILGASIFVSFEMPKEGRRGEYKDQRMCKTKRRGAMVCGKQSSEGKGFISLIMRLKSTTGMGNKMPAIHLNQSILLKIKMMLIISITIFS